MAKKNAIGLDIGTRTVHVAEVALSRGAPTITNFGGVELPEGAVREGEIVDTDAVAAAVKQLMGSTGIKGKDVMLGVANQRVVVRQIDLPWMEEQELRQSLRFQVQEYIPIPVEDAELDFHVLDDYHNDSDARMLRLLLVAAHRDMIASQIAAADAAGLRPLGIDLNPFALLRAVGNDSAVEQGSEVLVDVGAGVTNIVVHEQGVPRFVRILVLGGDEINRALSDRLGVSAEEAEERKHSARVGSGAGDEAAQVVDQQAGQFVDEIRSSLDYYQAQMGGARISRLVLSGGGALLQGLPDRLASTLRLPVELGNPFDRYDVGKNVKLQGEQLAQVGPVLTTAVGLGLGGVS